MTERETKRKLCDPYLPCQECGEKMGGITTYSVRLVCALCGGKALPSYSRENVQSDGGYAA